MSARQRFAAAAHCPPLRRTIWRRDRPRTHRHHDRLVRRFHAGGGIKKDIDNIQYLSENMLGRTFCPLGDAAALPTISIVKKFRKEFEDHLEGKPCPFERAGSVERLPVFA